MRRTVIVIFCLFLVMAATFFGILLYLLVDPTYSNYEAAVTKGTAKKTDGDFFCDRASYLRYEAVYFTFKSRELTEVPVIKIYRDRAIVQSKMNGRSVRMRYNRSRGVYEARWFPSLAPELGAYDAVLSFRRNGTDMFSHTSFSIDGRKPKNTDTPLSFVTLEALGHLLTTSNYIREDNTEGDWRNLVKTAKFMGADVVAANVGETTGTSPFLSPTNVWNKEKMNYLSTLAVEVKRENMKFGAWLHSFFIQFPGNETPNWLDRARARSRDFTRLGYTPSLKYESDAGEFTADWHCSLLDDKRITDMTELAGILSRDPNVDAVGLDYIRALPPGGLELVDDFVNDMWIERPNGFDGWTKEQKMLWLLKKRRDEYQHAWRYYKAKKEAEIVSRIKREGRVSKDLWVFNLGWAHGIEHGQDPLMFLDGGADFNFIMLYEIPEARDYDYLGGQWGSYIKGNDINIIVGNTVDTPLLLSDELNAVEEYTRRMHYAVYDLLKEGHPRGVFFHDLWRANFGRTGEYPAMEWIVAGGKAFSDLKAAYKKVPVTTEIRFNREKSGDYRVEAELRIMNVTGEAVGPFIVSVVPTPAVKAVSNRTVASLSAGETVSVPFSVAVRDRNETRRYAMIPFVVTWSSSDHTKRLFDYRYVKMRYGAVLPSSLRNTDEE